MRLLRPLSLLNPVSRAALMAFVWKHRHEVLRWGRSLYVQFVADRDVNPARAARTGKLLFTIASHPELRDARELRKVSLQGDVVDLDVDRRWRLLPDLIRRVEGIKGINEVRVNGTPATEPATTRRRALSA
jgi:hypothetical protein